MIIGTLVLVACGSDDDDVVVHEEGDGDRSGLQAPFELGQTAVTTMDMTITSEIEGVPGGEDTSGTVTIVATSEVTEMSDGEAAVEFTIDQANQQPQDEMTPRGISEITSFEGDVIVARYDEAGGIIGEPEFANGAPMPQSVTEVFDQSFDFATLPRDPVGVGARWSATAEAQEEGVTVEVETHYELIELTADEYVIEVTQDAPIDTEVDDVEVTGTYIGNGETRGSLTNPLLVDVSYELETEFEMSDGSDSATLRMDVAIDGTSR